MAHLDYNFLQLQTEDTNLLFRAARVSDALTLSLHGHEFLASRVMPKGVCQAGQPIMPAPHVKSSKGVLTGDPSITTLPV